MLIKKATLLFSLCIVLFLGTATVLKAQTTLHVHANIATSGNGSSWASAYKTLKDALAAATNPSAQYTILVARGSYYPTGAQNSTDRNATFLIRQKGGIKIYGGYPNGGGTRNIAANPTILSGDIGTANTNSDNSYHVLVVTNSTAGADSVVIDGFAITKGNANSSGEHTYNAQLTNQNAIPNSR